MSKHWNCLGCGADINGWKELDEHRKKCEQAVFLGDQEDE